MRGFDKLGKEEVDFRGTTGLLIVTRPYYVSMPGEVCGPDTRRMEGPRRDGDTID